MLKDVKAVFFDAGGTLFRPFPSVGEIYSRVAKRYGCHARPDHLDTLFRKAWIKRDGLSGLSSHSNEKVERDWWNDLVREVFEEVGGVERYDDFFDELYDLFAFPETWKLYPEVREVLDALKARGKRHAIISNWDSRLTGLTGGLGLEPYFEFVLASAVFGASKPSPKIFKEALSRMSLQAAEAVHVGDSFEDDIRGAQSVGLAAVLIDRHGDHPSSKEGIPVISNLRELLGG